MPAAGEPVTVLMVEDNPGDVRLAHHVLSQATIPIDLHTVANGRGALAFLRREDPYADAAAIDLVLLDMNLPDMDGRTILADIKADPVVHDIPVIVVSTSVTDRNAASMERLGAAGRLTKPLRLEAFMQVLDRVLRRQDQTGAGPLGRTD